MTNLGCTVVVHVLFDGDGLHEHVLRSPGAMMTSSSVQLGKGRHFDAPNMEYVFGGQVSHFC